MTLATRHTRRRSPVTRTRVSDRSMRLSETPGRKASGDRLVEAADTIADGIREVSSTFSRKIPESVDVRPAGADLVFVVATAPNADPIENGKRHPLFGNREYWYPMKKIPFMEQGVKLSIDDAAEVYGKTVDDWLKEVGWE